MSNQGRKYSSNIQKLLSRNTSHVTLNGQVKIIGKWWAIQWIMEQCRGLTHTTLTNIFIMDQRTQNKAFSFRKKTLRGYLCDKRSHHPDPFPRRVSGQLEAVWTAVSFQLLASHGSPWAVRPRSCCSWGGRQPLAERGAKSRWKPFPPDKGLSGWALHTLEPHRAGRDLAQSDKPLPNHFLCFPFLAGPPQSNFCHLT